MSELVELTWENKAKDEVRDAFVSQCVKKNRPGMIHAPDMVQKWPVSQDWAPQGQIRTDRMVQQCGSATVCVADCSKESFSSHHVEKMTLRQYIERWNQDDQAPQRRWPLYLKDWHVRHQFPEYGETMYSCDVLGDDWLNGFWDTCGKELQLGDGTDYRFVYLGPAGSWTPLHRDVFGSYSWSVNLAGKKKWVLFPPEVTSLLKQPHTNNTVFNLDNVDPNTFPGVDEALSKAITVHQNVGSILFVPSGWYHQVWNEKDTLSVNHNWGNGYNCESMLQALFYDLVQVEESLQDCIELMPPTEWRQQCQVVLRSLSGMDLIQFYQYLCFAIDTFAKQDLFPYKQVIEAFQQLQQTPYLCEYNDAIGHRIEFLNYMASSTPLQDN